ncbi:MULTISPECIES: Gfo/Idh/MocA family protein [Paraburkholderia]|uniref:Gfo/Idh/MocA family protein n=1 Tax=Paraburkholderia TaxID=1822464 RepID=UPI00321889CD
MIRYAVVGAGWISQEAFLPAVSQTGNSSIAAIVSGDAERARKLAEFYGVKHVASYSEFDALVSRDDIDAVYIAVPNPLHATYAIRAAKARKHVLVEKPIATTASDAEAMIQAAREANVLLMTSYRLHNEAGTVAALDAIRDGRIGDPRYMSAVFCFQSALGNHRLNSKHWGGPLQDIGIYCVNAARHIFASEPIEATAMTTRPLDDARFCEIDEAVAVTLRFPENRLAQFYCSFGAAEIDTYRVVGTDGVLAMDPGFRFEAPTRMILNTRSGTETVQFLHGDHFGGEIRYFSECIEKGVAPIADGEEGLADLRALLAIEAAARSGVPQAISTPQRNRHPTSDIVRTVRHTERRLML